MSRTQEIRWSSFLETERSQTEEILHLGYAVPHNARALKVPVTLTNCSIEALVRRRDRYRRIGKRNFVITFGIR
jgi:hypothetical protein